MPHVYLAPLEFRQDLCQQKPRVPRLLCSFVCVVLCLAFSPPPRRICFRRCSSVCLLASLRKNFRTDLHEIFREGWQWASEQIVKFWWRSGSPICIRIRIRIATLVRRALAEVCTVPVLLVLKTATCDRQADTGPQHIVHWQSAARLNRSSTLHHIFVETYILTVLKKGATIFLSLTLPNADRFSKFFHRQT